MNDHDNYHHHDDGLNHNHHHDQYSNNDHHNHDDHYQQESDRHDHQEWLDHNHSAQDGNDYDRHSMNDHDHDQYNNNDDWLQHQDHDQYNNNDDHYHHNNHDNDHHNHDDHYQQESDRSDRQQWLDHNHSSQDWYDHHHNSLPSETTITEHHATVFHSSLHDSSDETVVLNHTVHIYSDGDVYWDQGGKAGSIKDNVFYNYGGHEIAHLGADWKIYDVKNHQIGYLDHHGYARNMADTIIAKDGTARANAAQLIYNFASPD